MKKKRDENSISQLLPNLIVIQTSFVYLKVESSYFSFDSVFVWKNLFWVKIKTSVNDSDSILKRLSVPTFRHFNQLILY